MKKNINQHEVHKVNLFDGRFPPFLDNSHIIPTEECRDKQKMKISSLIMGGEYDVVIGTDGSTVKDGNRSLGPSAAAAVVYRKENMRQAEEVLVQYLGTLSHNYEAELV